MHNCQTGKAEKSESEYQERIDQRLTGEPKTKEARAGDTSFLRPAGFGDSHGVCAIEFKAGVRAATFKVEAQSNVGGWSSVLQLPIIMAARRPASDFPVRASREFHGWTKVMDQSAVIAKECFGRLNACTAREVFRQSFRPFLGSRSW